MMVSLNEVQLSLALFFWCTFASLCAVAGNTHVARTYTPTHTYVRPWRARIVFMLHPGLPYDSVSPAQEDRPEDRPATFANKRFSSHPQIQSSNESAADP